MHLFSARLPEKGMFLEVTGFFDVVKCKEVVSNTYLEKISFLYHCIKSLVDFKNGSYLFYFYGKEIMETIA